jgi:hypothetical protein
MYLFSYSVRMNFRGGIFLVLRVGYVVSGLIFLIATYKSRNNAKRV